MGTRLALSGALLICLAELTIAHIALLGTRSLVTAKFLMQRAETKAKNAKEEQSLGDWSTHQMPQAGRGRPTRATCELPSNMPSRDWTPSLCMNITNPSYVRFHLPDSSFTIISMMVVRTFFVRMMKLPFVMRILALLLRKGDEAGPAGLFQFILPHRVASSRMPLFLNWLSISFLHSEILSLFLLQLNSSAISTFIEGSAERP